ncbi:hypothetical protein [Amycolatopsis sp. PS_44_ISF1]|uniref:hypothetical protein n=1 Tax=Amycolatopsis sp. PS_44_ISF1 TaxID=2974917 RepID=UPI0028DF5061|nr:hypothetical protein [Amycolatopsis sp. PS_44_ISF1]MDT8912748.1 hypothetical protein [Amycolatopsis sp. PS_44_ISF1]
MSDGQAHDTGSAGWAVRAARHRAGRTVRAAGRAASPGLERVLADGTWTHPDAAPGFSELSGVLLVKPGTTVSAAAIRDIGVRLAECGYRAERARRLTEREIREGNLAVDHHRPHADLAERGTMTARERVTFLNRHDNPGFPGRFGERAEDLDVFPAQTVIDRLGVPQRTQTEWSLRDTARHGLDSGAPDGPNCIGDCLFAHVFQDPRYHAGRPFVSLNPHIPGILTRYHQAGSALAVQIAAVTDDALPWPRMRREFCGVTDPALAWPGSIRGDAFAGLIEVLGPGGGRVVRTANGVHLSNGAVEALQDAATWFGLEPGRTRPGRVFEAAGVPARYVVTRPFVALEGTRRAVQEVTDGASAETAAARLHSVSWFDHADDWDDSATVKLIDHAWRETAPVRRAGRATAILLRRGEVVVAGPGEDTAEDGDLELWRGR